MPLLPGRSRAGDILITSMRAWTPSHQARRSLVLCSYLLQGLLKIGYGV